MLPLEWTIYQHCKVYEELGASIADVNAWPNASAFIAATAGQFEAVILNRGPAVFPVMDEITRHHGHAVLILNTHDLHYIREGREAALRGDP